MTLLLSQIRTDGGTQPRSVIDYDAVDDYADLMQSGVRLPKVTVFYDGSDYWLADGFHRFKAAQQSDISELDCDVHQGTLHDAQWFSFGANQAHGLRRSNDDKQRAIKAALQHPKSAGMSDTAIAKHVGVSQQCVSGWRNKLTPSHKDCEIPQTRTVTRNGTTYQQNVTNIGRRAEVGTPDAPPTISVVVRAAQYTAPAPVPQPEPESDFENETLRELLRACEEIGACGMVPSVMADYISTRDDRAKVLELLEIAHEFIGQIIKGQRGTSTRRV